VGPVSQPEARREELLSFLRGLDLGPRVEIGDETSLLRSGLLDSLALFGLADWIERRLGAAIDPSQIDLLEEWDTVPRILDFLERRLSGGVR
jgi:acyl carrier protein